MCGKSYVVFQVKRNFSIRRFTRKHPLVVKNVRVPCRGKLLKRSSTSILLRAITSTYLKTVKRKSVNQRFPSASPRFGSTSSTGLLTRI